MFPAVFSIHAIPAIPPIVSAMNFAQPPRRASTNAAPSRPIPAIVTPPATAPIHPAKHRVPLLLKILLTAFVATLVPYYWHAYGPTNFLYFCDLALLLTLGAVWTENALLASLPAVGILLPQTFWCVDFLSGVFGYHPIGLTAYMFNSSLPLFTRGLSFFHFWLPFLLGWLVWRLGYDRRALVGWTLLAWVLMLISYNFLPAPPAPPSTPNLPVNVDYVFGFSDHSPQHWIPAPLFLTLMLITMPLCIFLPTHAALRKLCPASKR